MATAYSAALSRLKETGTSASLDAAYKAGKVAGLSDAKIEKDARSMLAQGRPRRRNALSYSPDTPIEVSRYYRGGGRGHKSFRQRLIDNGQLNMWGDKNPQGLMSLQAIRKVLGTSTVNQMLSSPRGYEMNFYAYDLARRLGEVEKMQALDDLGIILQTQASTRGSRQRGGLSEINPLGVMGAAAAGSATGTVVGKLTNKVMDAVEKKRRQKNCDAVSYNPTISALQAHTVEGSEDAARRVLQAWLMQDGCIGGRIIAPTPQKPGWRAQAFFEDERGMSAAAMPEGIMRVKLPTSLLKTIERRKPEILRDQNGFFSGIRRGAGAVKRGVDRTAEAYYEAKHFLKSRTYRISATKQNCKDKRVKLGKVRAVSSTEALDLMKDRLRKAGKLSLYSNFQISGRRVDVNPSDILSELTSSYAARARNALAAAPGRVGRVARILWDKFKRFQGRDGSRVTEEQTSKLNPGEGYRLGGLAYVKLEGGHIITANPAKAFLCADHHDRLFITGLRHAAPKGLGPRQRSQYGRIIEIAYRTAKAHINNGRKIEYWHPLGELTGQKPVYQVDGEGYPLIAGGAYSIDARGIIN